MWLKTLAIALVFMHWDLVTVPSFAGLDNLVHLATDTRFWRAVATWPRPTRGG